MLCFDIEKYPRDCMEKKKIGVEIICVCIRKLCVCMKNKAQGA